MNMDQDKQMLMVKDNVENQFRPSAMQNAENQVVLNASQNVGNQNGLSVVSKTTNQNGNGNVVTELAEGNGNGINGRSAEVHHSENCYDNDMFNMFTQEEKYTELIEPIPEPHQVSGQNDTTRGTSANTKFSEQSILGKPPSSSHKLYAVTPLPKSTVFPKVGEMNALSNQVTSTSVPSSQEPNVMKNDNVISSRIFRMNPFKASRVENFVPNKHVKPSVRTKPITVSQPHVITKNDVNSKTNGFSPKDVKSTTRTRRPQPRNNPKNDKGWKVYSVICSTNYSNGENQVVSKSSAVADASDKRQQQHDSTSSTLTLATTISVDGNFEFKNWRDLPRNTSLDRVEVLGMIEKRSKVRKGIVPTEMELVLEQTQQVVNVSDGWKIVCSGITKTWMVRSCEVRGTSC
uniref:Uncharacterized protein n=1 Tax=Tanacetum cinerariifolium TaxID=118510 RepID=A0A6L2JSC5_TANCI|nr:hypothetical protein [Tanacetum cinerariifolium]